LHLSKGNIPGAILALNCIKSLKNKPAMIATLVYLYEKANDIDNALKTFDEYLNWWVSQKERDEDMYLKILKENGNFKLRHHRFKEAAIVFEKVLEINKNDLDALPGAVIAYSSFDPEKAEKYGRRLPANFGQKGIDVDKLENVRVGSKPLKKEATVKGDLTKTKKKKKKILPKNLSKPLDPQRWIPLKQRSYYKRKSRKGKMDKGAQGGIAPPLEKGKITTEKTIEKPSSPPNSPPTERKEEVKEQKDSKQTSTASQNAKKQKKKRVKR